MTVDEVLAAWAGGGDIPPPAAPAPAEPQAAEVPAAPADSPPSRLKLHPRRPHQ